MTLAQRVRDQRYARGWGPDELASRASISRTALYQIESGKTEQPRAATVRRIAEALNIPTEVLLGPNLGVVGVAWHGGDSHGNTDPAGYPISSPTNDPPAYHFRFNSSLNSDSRDRDLERKFQRVVELTARRRGRSYPRSVVPLFAQKPGRSGALNPFFGKTKKRVSKYSSWVREMSGDSAGPARLALILEKTP